MVDIEGCARRVEFMLACCGALAQPKEAVGEFLAVVGQNGADADPLPGKAL